MRLIFIPGFGEDQRIFDKIAPELPGKKLFIHNQDLLGAGPMPTLTVIKYAQLLIEQHQLTVGDIIIGHSMGGWIAYAIKQLIDCRIVQISSWTDPKKVILSFSQPDYLYWLIRKGWCFNRFNKQLLLMLNYRNQPSAPIFEEVYQNLIDSPPEYVINQLRIILNPVTPTPSIEPDVRIHSKRDSIIRFPDQPASCVAGDHFNLFTYPQDVIAPINAFLTLVKLD